MDLENTFLSRVSGAERPTVRHWLPAWVRHTLGACIVIGLVLGLFIFTSLTSIDIFFWVFSFSLFWWNIDGRVSIAFALAFLITIPILLALHQYADMSGTEAWAEVVAVWVYFFLAIGVMKQVWEMAWEKKDKVVEEVIKTKPTGLTLEMPRNDGMKRTQVPAHVVRKPSPLKRPRVVDYVKKV